MNGRVDAARRSDQELKDAVLVDVLVEGVRDAGETELVAVVVEKLTIVVEDEYVGRGARHFVGRESQSNSL